VPNSNRPDVIGASLIDQESQPFKHGILDTLESQSLPNQMFINMNQRVPNLQNRNNMPNFGSLMQPNPDNGGQQFQQPLPPA